MSVKVTEALRAEARRFYADAAYRASLPCSECGKTGNCTHFPVLKGAKP